MSKGGKKQSIFRSVLLECMHISSANTFGLGELTAFEIPDILPKIQLQVIMILVTKESNK